MPKTISKSQRALERAEKELMRLPTPWTWIKGLRMVFSFVPKTMALVACISVVFLVVVLSGEHMEVNPLVYQKAHIAMTDMHRQNSKTPPPRWIAPANDATNCPSNVAATTHTIESFTLYDQKVFDSIETCNTLDLEKSRADTYGPLLSCVALHACYRQMFKSQFGATEWLQSRTKPIFGHLACQGLGMLHKAVVSNQKKPSTIKSLVQDTINIPNLGDILAHLKTQVCSTS